MTQLEKFRAFANRHADKKATAQYFLEDDSRGQLVLVTENRFTEVIENDEGDDKVTNINFKDATVDFFIEAPKEHPEVTQAHTLLVKSAKSKITAACLPYDYARIVRVTEGKLKENDDEDS